MDHQAFMRVPPTRLIASGGHGRRTRRGCAAHRSGLSWISISPGRLHSKSGRRRQTCRSRRPKLLSKRIGPVALPKDHGAADAIAQSVATFPRGLADLVLFLKRTGPSLRNPTESRSNLES